LQHRRRIAAVLRARRPALPAAAAMDYAGMVQYLLRAVPVLSPARAAEIEELVAAYLAPRLGGCR
ncbi:MAG: hypothetical protein ACRD2E_07690, partial [Terriglobales bacterium]